MYHIVIPLKYTFQTSFGVVAKRPAVIIKFESQEGAIGYGEASPLYIPISEPEVLDMSMKYLRQELPHIIGVELDDAQDLKSLLHDHKKFPVTYTGIEGAYYVTLAHLKNTPLFKLFGGCKSLVKAGESLGIKEDCNTIIAQIQKGVENGHDRIKLKIKQGHDLEIVRKARELFPDISLAVDANQAYSRDEVVHLHKLDEYNIAFIEQPFSMDDDESFIRFKALSNTPICLDESVYDLVSCKRTHEQGFCDMVNIKPARVGGFSESLEIYNYCNEHNIPLFGGGRMETGIGKLINSHLYSMDRFTYPSDITMPTEYFDEDVVNKPYVLQDGVLHLDETSAGIGIDVREDILEKYLVEKLEFSNNK